MKGCCGAFLSILLFAFIGNEIGQAATSLGDGDSTKLRKADLIDVDWTIDTLGWRFEVRDFKREAVPYQWMYLEVVLTNVSDNSMNAPPLGLYHGHLRPQLYDAAGDPVCQTRRKGMGLLRTYLLEPGESISKHLNLTTVFCPNETMRRRMLPPGSYNVVFNLYLDPNHETPREENTIILGPISFEIHEAEGDNTKAMELYEKGVSILSNNPDKAREYFYQILTAYSHTPFDEVVTLELSHARKGDLPLLDSSESLELRKRFFLKHPDSPYNIDNNLPNFINRISQDELKELYREIRDKAEASLTVQYLVEHYPWVCDKEADK